MQRLPNGASWGAEAARDEPAPADHAGGAPPAVRPPVGPPAGPGCRPGLALPTTRSAMGQRPVTDFYFTDCTTGGAIYAEIRVKGAAVAPGILG